MNTIFKTDAHRESFVRALKKMTMSGAVDADAAIERLIKNNPNYFIMPTPDDIAKISRAELNCEIRRRAQQTNKLADGFFRG